MAKKRRKQRPRRPPPAPGTAPAPAPWGSFPLVELIVLVALVMLIAAFVTGGPRSTALLATGLALGSLAGLELSIREHFAGFRSHTLLLAGAAGVATMALLFYAVPDLMPPVARVVVAGVVAIVSALLLARVFRGRSGGRLIKLR
jgi:hypothetical protein